MNTHGVNQMLLIVNPTINSTLCLTTSEEQQTGIFSDEDVADVWVEARGSDLKGQKE